MAESREDKKVSTNGASPTGWRRYRQEVIFLVAFVLILALSFTALALTPVNDHVVEPFTALVARTSGGLLNLIGQHVSLNGTIIRNSRFAVNIRNGCNGVEAMLIFLAAVLAFPATWKSRWIGLAIGIVAIQLINLIRVVALFLTGSYAPSWFNSSHTVIWQTIVILASVLLWIFWASRFAVRQPVERS
ncbi:MAG TPA: exosortase H [Thermoanaerobaculia bacterium]|nr:exosortase H [Thermoanaerobaculia bacterium]